MTSCAQGHWGPCCSSISLSPSTAVLLRSTVCAGPGHAVGELRGQYFAVFFSPTRKPGGERACQAPRAPREMHSPASALRLQCRGPPAGALAPKQAEWVPEVTCTACLGLEAVTDNDRLKSLMGSSRCLHQPLQGPELWVGGRRPGGPAP